MPWARLTPLTLSHSRVINRISDCTVRAARWLKARDITFFSVLSGNCNAGWSAIREFRQLLQLLAGRAGVNGLHCQGHGFSQRVSAAGGDQRRRSVHEHDVTTRRFFSCEDSADDLGVGFQVAAGDSAHRRLLQTKLL